MLGIMAEARPGAGKHHRGGGGKHRGSRRLAAAAPLAGAALCGALLLFALCRMGGSDDGELGDDLRAYADDPGALPGGDGGGRATWLSAAGLWAEEHVHHRQRAKASRYQQPSGCRVLPCSSQHLRRPPTLVLYAYNAADPQEQSNFDYFLKHAVDDADWLTYRLLLASGDSVLAPTSLPQLPPNARYVNVDGCTTSVWGILAAAAPQLGAELAAAHQLVVVGSAARGPFLPPYTRQFMHWTDALTSKLGRRTKLVGSVVTCEGAPKGGDAAAEWRLNPFVQPYAFALDKEGWELLAGTEEVLRCYASPWEARYHSDAGAALALLSAGFNIDTLLAKYQGLDWWNQRTWECNKRVRPDTEWTYDGVSITPHETVFVPFSQGPLQSEWSFVRQALKYGQWAEQQTIGAPQGNANAFVADAWGLRAQRMVYLNARGPGCFDFGHYAKHNPDMASREGLPQQLWEHFLLIGQFQGRPHRFTCPLQIGNSYRSGYVRARGRRCFDHNHYAKGNQDLRHAGINSAAELFNHYAEFGQFEMRAARYTCADSMFGLPAGFDTRSLDPLPLDPDERNAEKWKGLVEAASAAADAGVARLQQQQQQLGAQAGGEAGDGAQELAEEDGAEQQQQARARQLGETLPAAASTSLRAARALPTDKELVLLQHAALSESAANVAEQKAASQAASQAAAAAAAAADEQQAAKQQAAEMAAAGVVGEQSVAAAQGQAQVVQQPQQQAAAELAAGGGDGGVA